MGKNYGRKSASKHYSFRQIFTTPDLSEKSPPSEAYIIGIALVIVTVINDQLISSNKIKSLYPFSLTSDQQPYYSVTGN
jgi:hypothetical protein